MNYTADIKKLERHFIPNDLIINSWADIEPYFEQLQAREIDNKETLEKWLLDLSELEAAISEDACWRQIKMTCDTEDPALEKSFNTFCMEIQPHIVVASDRLNKKLMSSKALDQLDEKTYHTYLRNIRKSIDLFREENVELNAELAVLQQQFGQITGAMMVEIDGQSYTLQQAAKFLENSDRSVRENAWMKIQERRLQSKEALNELYDKLLTKRNEIAKNACFESYTDYRFKELGRFDYGVKESTQFQEAVRMHVVPLVKEIHEEKKRSLGLDELRPWDLDAENEQPLRPFKTGEELTQKTIDCFTSLDPFFAACLHKMQEMQHLDLDSRKGKAPGGYNCPLAESGAPFIFMNAAGKMDDVTTMVHEGGHAVHSFLAHPLKLTGFKEYPMEIAEVASMAMELFTMDHWGSYFSNAEELRRAKLHQLERVITIFPWIATIDKFQHWIYAHPNHTNEERSNAWMNILDEYSDGVVNFEGLQQFRENSWQRQLHLYEVPFYYIEYGIAQLGAIGLWMQYRQDPKKALENYCNALSLGGTRTLPELYEAAGLKFDFSPETIKTLMQFVQAQMQEIKNG